MFVSENLFLIKVSRVFNYNKILKNEPRTNENLS